MPYDKLLAKVPGIDHVLGSADKSTQNGRAMERHRRITLTAIASALTRATSLLTMLVSVRLVVKHFGAERYALWATITSTAAMLVFADFGIGNGLLNSISESDGKEDKPAALAYISTGFFVLLAIALLGTFALFAFYPIIPWFRIFNVTSALAVHESGPAAAIFIICFLAQLPLGVVQRVQFGYQEGFVTQLWSAAGNLLGLIGLLYVIHAGAGLPLLVAVVAGAPVATALVNAAIEFGYRRPWLKPRLAHISRVSAKRILHLGFLFFVMQVCGALGYQTDNLIIAQVRGAAKVTEYAVPFRLFSVLPAVISLVVAPLWPAYAEAKARGDVEWVKTTLKKSMYITAAIAIPINFLLIASARFLIRFWIGPAIIPSLLLLVGLGTWSVFTAVSGPLASFLNGIGFIKVQAICSVFMAVMNIGLSIYLTRHIGISGVVYGSILSQLCCIFIPYGLLLPRVLAREERQVSNMPLTAAPIDVVASTVQV